MIVSGTHDFKVWIPDYTLENDCFFLVLNSFQRKNVHCIKPELLKPGLVYAGVYVVDDGYDGSVGWLAGLMARDVYAASSARFPPGLDRLHWLESRAGTSQAIAVSLNCAGSVFGHDGPGHGQTGNSRPAIPWLGDAGHEPGENVCNKELAGARRIAELR